MKINISQGFWIYLNDNSKYLVSLSTDIPSELNIKSGSISPEIRYSVSIADVIYPLLLEDIMIDGIYLVVKLKAISGLQGIRPFTYRE